MADEKKAKPRNVWGQSQAAYLEALKDKQVTVVFVDGKALKGALTGVGMYELFIQQKGGLEVMIPKGNIKYLHGAEP